MRRGKELEQDPEYQRRLQDPVWRERILNTTSTTLNETLPQGAKKSVYLFLFALVVIVAIAMIPEIRTIGSGKAISMSLIIQMMMLCFGGVILLATKTKSSNRAKWRGI
ncbi:C4-dicarboxylate antiporter [Haemophilus influenzae]|uniref:C4-dicarboxylate antiporter n=1 Tax=Haemophilus influenzae TaxID=727 RepID=A0A2X1PJV0_HAEIF|nr:C4-dicarboxylate antiporter [Haemophilus influenzae]